ncbi:hypothetical protein LXL04_020009 [Taraxacum kok-saghyz]
MVAFITTMLRLDGVVEIKPAATPSGKFAVGVLHGVVAKFATGKLQRPALASTLRDLLHLHKIKIRSLADLNQTRSEEGGPTSFLLRLHARGTDKWNDRSTNTDRHLHLHRSAAPPPPLLRSREPAKEEIDDVRGICLQIISCDRTWMNKAVDEQDWVPASLIAGFKKVN